MSGRPHAAGNDVLCPKAALPATDTQRAWIDAPVDAVRTTSRRPEHEHHFEELGNWSGQPAPDPKHIADLRSGYGTKQLSARKK